jgi:hypothetical protein
MTDAIRLAAKRVVEGDKTGLIYLAKIADKLVREAAEGTPWAVKEVIDRLDGKAAQSLEVTGEVTTKLASELTDDQLADIIARHGGNGAVKETDSPRKSDSVH